MKDYFNLRKSKLLLLALLAAFAGGVSPAWATDVASTNFDDLEDNTLPSGWTIVGGTIGTEFEVSNSFKHGSEGKALYANYSSTNSAFIVTPVLEGEVTFYYANSGNAAGSIYIYEAIENGNSYQITGSALFSKTWNKVSTQRSPSWSSGSITLTSEKRLAICLVKGVIDDFAGTLYVETLCPKPKALTATNVTDESAVLGWTSGSDTWSLRYMAEEDADWTIVNDITDNPYTLIGLDAGTNYTFQVQAVCSATDQSDWSSTNAFATLLCSPSVQKNISYELHDQYSDGWNGASITISDVTTGTVVATLTITSGTTEASNKTASGTIALCPNREYSFTWTKGSYDGECSYTIKDVDGNDLYTHAQGASTTAGAIGDNYSWSNTPVDGAKFAIVPTTYDFGIKNVNDVAQQTFTITNSGNANLTVTTTDATDFTVEKIIRFSETRQWSDVYLYTWTGEGDAKVEQLGAWPGEKQTNYLGMNQYNQGIYAISIPAGTEKLILHNNSGDQSETINMDFSKTGLYLDNNKNGVFFAAEEEGIVVPARSGDTDGSFTFKVQMNTATAGVKDGNIALAFTAVNATSPFTIPVSGIVLPADAEVVDFNSAIPSRWENESNGWSIDNGAAKCTGKKNLTTQKLDFSGETSPFFVMKVKASDSGSGDYLSVEGSADNGATWTAFDKKTYSYPTDFGANTGEYATIVVDIPNTVNKLRFNGYYVLIDEIASLVYSNNDPAMGVYTDAECTAANKIATASVTANFDFVTTDPTPVTYYIKNDGTGTMELSKTDVDGLTVTLDKTEVAAGEHATLTIAMPVANNGGYHGGDVVVTATDLGTFTVTAQGVVLEEGKLNLNFATDAIPTTWTANNWSKNSSGYVEVGYSSSTMQTSTLVAEEGEALVVLAKQSYTSSSYTFGVKYRQVGDENWSNLIPAANIGTSYVMLHGTIADAGNYELQFTGNYTQIQRIYGLSKPEAPEMVVYDGDAVAGATFSFNKVTDENDATHEFTVKNEGLAKLTGLTATLGGDNADHYTVAITGATGDNNDEIEAGAEATVTVTQLKNHLGAHSATLTISATGLDSKEITLSGNTVDHTVLDVDFDTSSAWPAEILEHDGWNTYYSTYTNDGYIYNSTSTAASLILTPLTVANLTDKLTFQAKYYTSSRDLTVRYTTDGGITWNNYVCSEEEPTTSFKSQIGSSFKELVVTNIPAGTVAFDLYGKSIYLDNIAGDMKVTSAPLMAFSTVSDNISGANLKADATATYTLENKGNADYVGTVAATNVTVDVTGDDVTLESNTLTIPVGKTATITVTMAFVAPYREKSGSLAITSESWVGDINESYTATLVAPTDFVEDFAANAKPAGWYSEGWSYTGGVASVNAGVEKSMITELIGAEEGKNTLTFNAWSTSENQTLNIYTSTDRKNWTQLGETITLTNDETTVYTRTLTNNDQYIKFGAAIAKVDNINGVKKLEAPAHDLYEVSTTMAATGTPGASYTATVVGVSLRADETDIMAELWLKKGDEYTKVAYSENETMTVNTNKTFTLTGNLPNVEGEYKMWVTVKKASDESVHFNTDEINFTLAHTHTMAITTFPNAAVKADDNNQYAGTFFVTVKNTGSAAIAANDVSVSLIDNADAEHVITTAWTAESSNVLYMNTKKNDQDIASGENCVLKAWCWNTDTDGEWITFTNVNDGFWSLNLNGKTNFKIVRYNGAGTDENPWNNVWNQSGNLTLASGNLVKFNGYDNGDLTFAAESMAYLDPTMTTTLKVTVSGTLTDGEDANFSFKAKENLSNTYYSLTSNLSVTAAPIIELDEAVGTIASTGANRKVMLNRTFLAGWNTVCLPFAIDVATLFDDDENASAYEFAAYDNGELSFNKVMNLEAGKPYLVYVGTGFTTKTLSNVEVSATTPVDVTNTVVFKGTYAPIEAGNLTGKYVVSNSDAQIKKATSATTMKGFRAYFENSTNARLSIVLNDDTQGIRAIMAEEIAPEGVYNLNGQKVEQLKKGGLYIINGKKQVVK